MSQAAVQGSLLSFYHFLSRAAKDSAYQAITVWAGQIYEFGPFFVWLAADVSSQIPGSFPSDINYFRHG